MAHAAACGAVCLCCCLRKAVQSCCEVRRAARLAVGGADRPLFDSSWVLQLSCVALGQERDAAAASEGGLVTFRQQMGYGVHVLVMMGTFYALGHYAAAHVSRSAAHVRPLSLPRRKESCVAAWR